VSVMLSAGPTWFQIGASAEPLAYTVFHAGGHGVVFEDNHGVAVDLQPQYGIGFDAGADVSAAITARLAIVAGYRYFGGRDTEVSVTPSAILNADQLGIVQPLADIVTGLASTRGRLSILGPHLFVGVKLR